MQLSVTYRLSEGVFGGGNDESRDPHISGDGSRVAYESDASNLVLFDPNGATDVFIGEIGVDPVLLTLDLFGQPSNGPSYEASISSDGSCVAFSSDATDLILGDSNSLTDVFVLDVATLSRERVSVGSAGGESIGASSEGQISRSGEAVAFTSMGSLAPPSILGFPTVFVRDLTVGATWCASLPTGLSNAASNYSIAPTVAQGGAVVAFHSEADNLTTGDTNGKLDVFVRTAYPDPVGYCTPTVTTQGCQPLLTHDGWPSASQATSFHLIGDDLPNRRVGLVFYGFGGRASNPWSGSTMCIEGVKKRTPLLDTLGNPLPADDCSGYFAFDVHAFAAGGLGGNPAPELSTVGQTVGAQFWGREGPTGTYLTTAVE